MSQEDDNFVGLAPGEMIYRSEPRRSRAVLELLSFARYLDEAEALVAAVYGEDETLAGFSFGVWGDASLYDDGLSSVYVVCQDGVAFPASDDEPFQLEVCPYYTDRVLINSRDDLALALSPDDLRACRTGEKINLANFINVRGDRLEDNFEELNREFYPSCG